MGKKMKTRNYSYEPIIICRILVRSRWYVSEASASLVWLNTFVASLSAPLPGSCFVYSAACVLHQFVSASLNHRSIDVRCIYIFLIFLPSSCLLSFFLLPMSLLMSWTGTSIYGSSPTRRRRSVWRGKRACIHSSEGRYPLHPTSRLVIVCHIAIWKVVFFFWE